MTYDLTDDVEAIGSINFEGNIIPIEWYRHLRLPNNKPDLVSIILLSDIIYWYRPTTIRDEISSKIIGYRKKFKSDLLQKGYKDLEDLFGFSPKQTREAFIRLESLGIIQRIFRTIESNGTKLSNVMFIKIFPTAIKYITNSLPISPQGNTYFPTGKHLLPLQEITTSPQGSTYTETTTNITTNNSLSLKAKKVYNQTKQSALVKIVEKERENEMLKIWNELVEEKNDTIIKLTPKREKLLNLRLKKVFNNDISLWKNLCKKISSSKFLMGEVTSFKATLDWTLKEENLIKIMENSYSMGDRLVAENKDSIEVIDEVINDPIWKKTREELKKQLGEGVFKSWISKLSFQAISDNIAHFTAPTKFIKEWIITNYSEDIKRNFNAIGINVEYINIENA
jgi:hypothetical protein